MKLKFTSIMISLPLIVAATLANAQNQKAAIDFRVPRIAQPPQPSHLVATAKANAPAEGGLDISTKFFSAGSVNSLPLWTFNIKGSRDGEHHLGTIVGHSPFLNAGTDRVPVNLVPLIIKVHRVATAVNPKTLIVTTAGKE